MRLGCLGPSDSNAFNRRQRQHVLPNAASQGSILPSRLRTCSPQRMLYNQGSILARCEEHVYARVRLLLCDWCGGSWDEILLGRVLLLPLDTLHWAMRHGRWFVLFTLLRRGARAHAHAHTLLRRGAHRGCGKWGWWEAGLWVRRRCRRSTEACHSVGVGVALRSVGAKANMGDGGDVHGRRRPTGLAHVEARGEDGRRGGCTGDVQV